MSEAKQFDISKKAVIAAFQAVKENAGSYGADEQTIKEFEYNECLDLLQLPPKFLLRLLYRFRRCKSNRFLHVCLLVSLHQQYEPCNFPPS